LALQKLWFLCEEEGLPSRLLVRAAGCEILAELCRLSGSPLATVNGGLAPLAKRRSIEAMRTRMAEDLCLDKLAAESGLSVFHFARMFKQSLGVPPRVYLTQLRMEKAIELLQSTELSITEIAQEVGYSSSQVLARIFLKHYHRSPTDYRRVVRNTAT
jgi:AraC family transcriptional regulator